MKNILYNRGAAVEYAHRWAFERNPQFGNFAGMGGNCANFASQCIYAGVMVMNFTPVFGWYYRSLNDRTPSWSGVKYLYNFLIGNSGVGPWATETDISAIQPGDIIQISLFLPEFHHTLVVVSTGEIPSPANILVAANSYDSDNRPLNTYAYSKIRFLHIEGARGW